MDGRGPLAHQPDHPGEQERWPVLPAVGPVHDLAVDRGLHARQDVHQERGDQGAFSAHLRCDPRLGLSDRHDLHRWRDRHWGARPAIGFPSKKENY